MDLTLAVSAVLAAMPGVWVPLPALTALTAIGLEEMFPGLTMPAVAAMAALGAQVALAVRLALRARWAALAVRQCSSARAR
jgi:hypothetical protein